ncbi:chalcone synthase-like [Oryza sativa Japonica Group]|uniref:Chalcone synthase-like n=2 Tax=Oryza sativa subsp. japonica TaxID=39947 RepID=Q5ZBB6_ORYSJ|nr:chalcone synthase-like [Oryza sativa Japonica Group]BAD53112.1 chalcone synthase-like [Oryza sativa Japonica Group]
MAAENGHRGSGIAAIMGIGKAVPAHVFPQKSFPDYYFDISNSNHMELANHGVPRLGAEAARAAIADWGGRASDITHLVFVTSTSGCLPGADFELLGLLGLPPSTKRAMVYQAGCYGGGTALRLAKDLAENSPGARVLVVCSEVIALVLRGPSESHVGNLVGQAIFGDAAGAVVVGSCPAAAAGERAMFEIVSASQEVVPGTRDAVVSELREEGIVFTLHRDVPRQIGDSIGRLVERALLAQQQPANAAIGAADAAAPDLNGMFWVVHAGGREILDRMESKLGLGKEKLEASRAVMAQYGNTRSSCVVLVMEEMRRRSEERGLRTAGEGLDMGMLVGFGPGLTVETIVLRALPIN